jgi:tubulin alpha
MAATIVEPYNAALTIHSMIEDLDVAMMMDNQSLYNICENKLGIESPDYSNLNRLIA